MLVSISPDLGAESNFTVPASPLIEPEALISAVPSARQKTSASSVSTRLHWGQRFIFGVLRPVAAFSLRLPNSFRLSPKLSLQLQSKRWQVTALQITVATRCGAPDQESAGQCVGYPNIDLL